jgi:hypothetical protein
MWFLSWTSGVFEQDSNESTHLKELPGLTSITQQLEAREHAIIAWEEVLKNPDAIKTLYRDPQLVWKESLNS